MMMMIFNPIVAVPVTGQAPKLPSLSRKKFTTVHGLLIGQISR